MRVIAIKTGFDGLCVRDPETAAGQLPFEMPEGSKGSWFVPIDEDGKPIKAKAESKPKASKTEPKTDEAALA